MDVVCAVGRTPVLLSVFLVYIKVRSGKLSDEERDEAADNLACPPMPPSLHYLYQEAIWGAIEAQVEGPFGPLEILEKVAFENVKKGKHPLWFRSLPCAFLTHHCADPYVDRQS